MGVQVFSHRRSFPNSFGFGCTVEEKRGQ